MSAEPASSDRSALGFARQVLRVLRYHSQPSIHGRCAGETQSPARLVFSDEAGNAGPGDQLNLRR